MFRQILFPPQSDNDAIHAISHNNTGMDISNNNNNNHNNNHHNYYQYEEEAEPVTMHASMDSYDKIMASPPQSLSKIMKVPPSKAMISHQTNQLMAYYETIFGAYNNINSNNNNNSSKSNNTNNYNYTIQTDHETDFSSNSYPEKVVDDAIALRKKTLEKLLK